MTRIFALSDVHVDYPDNLQWIRNLSLTRYQNDTLILAGDTTHVFEKLDLCLRLLKDRFREVAFVPGNHELWVQSGGHSLDKFHQILALCRQLNVHTEPFKIQGISSAWIVPLFSWYLQPHEGDDSLFLEKPGEDASLSAWSDNYFVKWPNLAHDATPAHYFLKMNRDRVARAYDSPVISFSHFLPRQDLIFTRPEEMKGKKPVDPHPGFNFSRVAGDAGIDRQIRQLGACIHIYGHQHRNRWRVTDGVLYVSHCLGYGVERQNGFIRDLDREPRLVWDTATPNGNQDLAAIQHSGDAS